MDLTTWWIFACATAVIAGTPGPNMLHIMTRSARFGFRASIVAMAGCLSAVVLCVTASSLGLGALLMASRTLFEVLRYVGVAYLLWLAWTAWRAVDEPTDGAPTVAAARPIPRLVMYRTALFTGLSNPKLIVFAAAFFPQFIHADRPWGPQFAILVATFGAIEVACYCLYAAGGARLAAYLSSGARRRLFNRATGGLFALFGFGLLAYRA